MGLSTKQTEVRYEHHHRVAYRRRGPVRRPRGFLDGRSVVLGPDGRGWGGRDFDIISSRCEFFSGRYSRGAVDAGGGV